MIPFHPSTHLQGLDESLFNCKKNIPEFVGKKTEWPTRVFVVISLETSLNFRPKRSRSAANSSKRFLPRGDLELHLALVGERDRLVNFLGHESEATFSHEVFEWHWILTRNGFHQDQTGLAGKSPN